jgi:hypothetical protein
MVFVESTAEGTGGDFYEMVKEAQRLEAELHAQAAPRQRLEFKLHFYPWWKERKYRIDPTGITINAENAVFQRAGDRHGIKLDAEQAAWYVVMKRPEGRHEARVPVDHRRGLRGRQRGALLRQQMLALRKRGPHQGDPVPAEPGLNLFLDIGRDMIAVWAHQYVNGEHRFVDYYEVSGRRSTPWRARRSSAAGWSSRSTCRTTATTRAW